MLLDINWSDPTIIGGSIGVIGSILGAIVGALFTIFLTWLYSRGKIKFYILENEFEISEGLLSGNESYQYKTNTGDLIREGIKLKFKCLIANSKKENYSFSNLEFIAINNKNKFQKSYILKDKNQPHRNGGCCVYENAENYVLEERSNIVLDLQFIEVGADFYTNHKNAKFYIKYIDYKGKNKYKRVYPNLNNPEIVYGI